MARPATRSDAGVEHAVVAARDAVDDEAAEAAAGQVGADRGGGDDLQDGDAEAAHDDRRGQGQLHARQDLALGEAHAPRRLDDVAVDLAEAGVRRHEDGRDGQQHHGQEDGQEAQPQARVVAEHRGQAEHDRAGA